MKKLSFAILFLIAGSAFAGPKTPVVFESGLSGSAPVQAGSTNPFHTGAGWVDNFRFYQGVSSGTYSIQGGTLAWSAGVSTGTRIDKSTVTQSNHFQNGTVFDSSTRTFQGAGLTGTVTDSVNRTLSGAITSGTATDHSTTTHTGSHTFNSLSLTSLTATTVSASVVTCTTCTIDNINGSGVWGFRNRILNGEFRLDQQNSGGVYTTNAASTFRYMDGWDGSAAGADGVFTVIRENTSPPAGFTHYARIKVTTADASIGSGQRYYLQQITEGQFTKDFLFGSGAARTISLYFIVRSSVTGTFSGAISNGLFNRGYPFTYSINSANVWEEKNVIIPGDTTGTWGTSTSEGLRVVFSLGVGTDFSSVAGTWAAAGRLGATGETVFMNTVNATFDITGVQLELNTKSSFEYLPDEVTLVRAQRYFEKSYDTDTATGTATATNAQESPGVAIGANEVNGSFIAYKTTKRTIPALSFWTTAGAAGVAQWYNAAGSPTNRVTSASGSTTKGFCPRQIVNNTDLTFFGHWVADSRF